MRTRAILASDARSLIGSEFEESRRRSPLPSQSQCPIKPNAGNASGFPVPIVRESIAVVNQDLCLANNTCI
jgi:hypothetical protein